MFSKHNAAALALFNKHIKLIQMFIYSKIKNAHRFIKIEETHKMTLNKYEQSRIQILMSWLYTGHITCNALPTRDGDWCVDPLLHSQWLWLCIL